MKTRPFPARCYRRRVVLRHGSFLLVYCSHAMIDGTVGDCRRMTSDSELVVLLSLELRLRDEPLTVSQWKHASHVGLVDVIATPWTQLLDAPELGHPDGLGGCRSLLGITSLETDSADGMFRINFG